MRHSTSNKFTANNYSKRWIAWVMSRVEIDKKQVDQIEIEDIKRRDVERRA